MRKISDSAFWDLCQNCTRVHTKRSIVDSAFNQHYCKLNIRPSYEWGCYCCDRFEEIDFDELTKKSKRR